MIWCALVVLFWTQLILIVQLTKPARMLFVRVKNTLLHPPSADSTTKRADTRAEVQDALRFLLSDTGSAGQRVVLAALAAAVCALHDIVQSASSAGPKPACGEKTGRWLISAGSALLSQRSAQRIGSAASAVWHFLSGASLPFLSALSQDAPPSAAMGPADVLAALEEHVQSLGETNGESAAASQAARQPESVVHIPVGLLWGTGTNRRVCLAHVTRLACVISTDGFDGDSALLVAVPVSPCRPDESCSTPCGPAVLAGQHRVLAASLTAGLAALIVSHDAIRLLEKGKSDEAVDAFWKEDGIDSVRVPSATRLYPRMLSAVGSWWPSDGLPALVYALAFTVPVKVISVETTAGPLMSQLMVKALAFQSQQQIVSYMSPLDVMQLLLQNFDEQFMDDLAAQAASSNASSVFHWPIRCLALLTVLELRAAVLTAAGVNPTPASEQELPVEFSQIFFRNLEIIPEQVQWFDQTGSASCFAVLQDRMWTSAFFGAFAFDRLVPILEREAQDADSASASTLVMHDVFGLPWWRQLRTAAAAGFRLCSLSIPASSEDNPSAQASASASVESDAEVDPAATFDADASADKPEICSDGQTCEDWFVAAVRSGVPARMVSFLPLCHKLGRILPLLINTSMKQLQEAGETLNSVVGRRHQPQIEDGEEPRKVGRTSGSGVKASQQTTLRVLCISLLSSVSQGVLRAALTPSRLRDLAARVIGSVASWADECSHATAKYHMSKVVEAGTRWLKEASDHLLAQLLDRVVTTRRGKGGLLPDESFAAFVELMTNGASAEAFECPGRVRDLWEAWLALLPDLRFKLKSRAVSAVQQQGTVRLHTLCALCGVLAFYHAQAVLTDEEDVALARLLAAQRAAAELHSRERQPQTQSDGKPARNTRAGNTLASALATMHWIPEQERAALAEGLADLFAVSDAVRRVALENLMSLSKQLVGDVINSASQWTAVVLELLQEMVGRSTRDTKLCTGLQAILAATKLTPVKYGDWTLGEIAVWAPPEEPLSFIEAAELSQSSIASNSQASQGSASGADNTRKRRRTQAGSGKRANKSRRASSRSGGSSDPKDTPPDTKPAVCPIVHAQDSKRVKVALARNSKPKMLQLQRSCSYAIPLAVFCFSSSPLDGGQGVRFEKPLVPVLCPDCEAKQRRTWVTLGGPYCKEHTLSTLGVDIGHSVRHGLGVFATRALLPGCADLPMLGELLERDAFLERYGPCAFGPYVVELSEGKVLDSALKRGIGAIVNTPCADQPESANAKITVRGQEAFVTITTPIRKGEEILAVYNNQDQENSDSATEFQWECKTAWVCFDRTAETSSMGNE